MSVFPYNVRVSAQCAWFRIYDASRRSLLHGPCNGPTRLRCAVCTHAQHCAVKGRNLQCRLFRNSVQLLRPCWRFSVKPFGLSLGQKVQRWLQSKVSPPKLWSKCFQTCRFAACSDANRFSLPCLACRRRRHIIISFSPNFEFLKYTFSFTIWNANTTIRKTSRVQFLISATISANC